MISWPMPMKPTSIRIISGSLKGRKIPTFPGTDIRPTSERAREALFSILAQKVRGAALLDLFAGTGAIGLEALSRGAAHVVFVEHNVTAGTAIEKILNTWGIDSSASIFNEDVLLAIQNRNLLRYRPFDVVYIDPPYRIPDIQRVLTTIEKADLMAPQGTIVFEHRSNFQIIPWIGSWKHYRTTRYGHSSLSFFQPDPTPSEDNEP